MTTNHRMIQYQNDNPNLIFMGLSNLDQFKLNDSEYSFIY